MLPLDVFQIVAQDSIEVGGGLGYAQASACEEGLGLAVGEGLLGGQIIKKDRQGLDRSPRFGGHE